MSDWQQEAQAEMWDAIAAQDAERAARERAQQAASIRASVERDSWNAVGMRAEIGECGYPTRGAA